MSQGSRRPGSEWPPSRARRRFRFLAQRRAATSGLEEGWARQAAESDEARRLACRWPESKRARGKVILVESGRRKPARSAGHLEGRQPASRIARGESWSRRVLGERAGNRLLVWNKPSSASGAQLRRRAQLRLKARRKALLVQF